MKELMIRRLTRPTVWRVAAAVSKPCCLSPFSSHGLLTLHLIMGIYCRTFFFELTWRDKQPDESGVMHRLTGTDSTQPTVNICRQDRISALAVERCIYLPLARLITALSFNYHVWEVQIIHAKGTTPNHYQHIYTVCFSPCSSELHFIEQRL